MKEMVVTTSDFVSITAVLVLCLFTYITTLGTLAWVFVILGGIVSLASLFLLRKYTFYAGIACIGTAFFTVHYKLSLTDTFNIIMVTGMFFLLYLTLTVGESNLLVRRIRREVKAGESDPYLKELEKESLRYDFKVVFLTTVLTLVGIFIFQTSYIGIELGEFERAAFVLGLTAVLLVLIYLLVQIMPQRVLEKENS